MELHRRDIQQDIHMLGKMLGDILRTHQSEDVFDSVERLRILAIEHRSDDADLHATLQREYDELNTDDAITVARAFTTYFELVNLAEERERIRALREQVQADVSDEGLEEAVEYLDDADPATIQQVLDDILIQPTFTAHPTEARRKTVKAKLRSVATDLETLDENLLTDKEETQLQHKLHSEVMGIWQTRQVRNRSPEPFDEVLNVQWYLENVLFDVVGEVYDEFEDALDDVLDTDDVKVPKLFEFRSWAGSDRDGNPYVTPDVTTRTLERQRRVTLKYYRDAIKELSGVLTQDSDRLVLSERVAEQLKANQERFPASTDYAVERYANEPYRQQLKLMRERLDRVDDPRTGGYADADELRTELDALASDLRSNDSADIAEVHVDPLIRKVETFGFTLANLDLRDHQANHTQAITEALERQGTDYATMDESDRITFLTEAILQDEQILDLAAAEDLSETAARVLTRFDKLADWQREFGTNAIDTYCISMCEEPSHILEVLFLADQARVVDLPENCGLDVVPLLETEYALSGARRIMGELFENEAYAAALAARGSTQEIMLGYSDSNKENGYLAAQWSLYRNQKRLAEICADHGLELRLFHGRGGSISRGGGPMNEALLALPNESITGQVKFTEQGEAIAEKYANPRIAERELEQMLNAQLRARLDAITTPVEPVKQEWLDAMETAAQEARSAYRGLLETEGFVSYFEQATPITVIENLNLGSRPASRSKERSIGDLRAIPWVFSWTQARCIIPGWYSLAAGLDAYLDSGGELETLREMYQSWPFFQTVVNNAGLALAQTDMEIATAYSELASKELRDRIFPEIQTEYERTIELVHEITQAESLPIQGWLVESLERRNPYVDPLNHLQIRLLAEESRTEAEEQTLRLAVKGIAAGMKNTG